MHFETEAKQYTEPEEMAAAYLSQYYGNQEIEYPINPFKMLKDEGILFSIMDLKKLEGVYIPASSENDIPVVGINVNRPITRQRFSAAHELCHHFRDANQQILTHYKLIRFCLVKANGLCAKHQTGKRKIGFLHIVNQLSDC